MELILIIATVTIFYIRTLEYSIIVDDIRQYAFVKNGDYKWRKQHKNPVISLIKNIRNKLYSGGTFGANTIYDHAFTTALHAVTCCLIYIAFNQTTIALWTSLLYAVNPINNQTAIWINGRRYQIVIILSLLALIFKPIGYLFYMMTPIFQFTAFFLPVLYMDISPLFLIPPLISIFLMRKFIRESYQERMKRIWNNDQKLWSFNRVKVVIKVYGTYFFKMIHPGVTMMNYKTLIEWGVTKRGNEDAYKINWEFVKGLLAFMLTTIFILIPELRLYTLFLFLGTIQWSALVCCYQNIADRYISLVNVFMMFIISYLFHTLPYGSWLCACLFVYYATQLNVTMKMYETIDRMYEYQMFWEPTMSRNRLIYAGTYMEGKDPTRAWLIVERGLFYEPNDFELLMMAARCSASVGMLDKAEGFLQRCEQNYYIGQEELQKQRISVLRQQMMAMMSRYKQQESRQVRRQQERNNKKEKT